MFWTNAWQKKDKKDENGATDADDWLADVREGLIDIAKEIVCHQLHKGSSTSHTHREQSCPEHEPEPRLPKSPKHPLKRPDNMQDHQAASVVTPRVLAASVNSHMHEEYARLHKDDGRYVGASYRTHPPRDHQDAGRCSYCQGAR